jgi:hypothetical protein
MYNGYRIKMKYLPVSLKNVKFLHFYSDTQYIVPEFFENFKSVRGGCF